MKEGEQSSFLDIIDSDPVMVANQVLYERQTVMQRARERRANKVERQETKKDLRQKKKMFRIIHRRERQELVRLNAPRNVKNELEMRVFRLDTEITDMKVELAGLISQARARQAIIQDIEWQNR